MAPRQKTFELVPNAPEGLRGLAQHHQQHQQEQPTYSKPPMTTKQAKKLHRQANRGPKLSKAEQRRIELMEQDRIRKEFEKEKQQARARTARERKKAKEEKEREERRRKGLPMVDVHPSQDVISRFITRGAGKKRDTVGAAARLDTLREEDTDSATEAGSGADAGVEEYEEVGGASDKENQAPAGESGDERKAKRPRLGQPEDEMPEGLDPVPRPRPAGAVTKIAQELGTESCSRASSVDVDDPINETLLENQLIADVLLASSRKTANSSPARQSPPADSTPCHASTSLAGPAAPREPPPPRALSPKPPEPQQVKSHVRAALGPSNTGPENKAMPRFANGPFKKPATPYAAVTRQGPAMKSPAVGMQPAPPKFKPPAIQQSHPCERPRFLPKHFRTPQQRQNAPIYEAPGQSHAQSPETTSTQRYLLRHVDDIFPSPSQEAAELLGGQVRVVEENPRPTTGETNSSRKMQRHIAAPMHKQSVSPSRPWLESMPLGLLSAVDASLDFPISTQELIMSSQDIRDIETPSKIRRSPLVQMSPQIVDGKGPPPEALGGHAHRPAGPFSGEKAPEKSTVAKLPQAMGPRERHSTEPQGPASRNATHPGISRGVACCQGAAGPESFPGACRSEGHKMPDPSLRKTPPKAEEKQKDCHNPTSSHLQCSLAKQRQVMPRSDNANSAAGAHNSKAVPEISPPKKRMFGSSGPGAEVLVAMERSFQESRRRERVREQALRDEEALKQTARQMAEQEQIDMQLMELADDDFPEDDLSPFTNIGGSAGPLHGVPGERGPSAALVQQGVEAGGDALAEARGDSGGNRIQVASQETDYGGSELDAENEVLDFLEADTTWLDDDLDDGI